MISEYEDTLLWLSYAGLVHRIFRISRPGLPVSAYDDLIAFKLYLIEVGLLRMLLFLDPISATCQNPVFIKKFEEG